jgi:RNA polymerase sigma-70 factor (ECF subfamily)
MMDVMPDSQLTCWTVIQAAADGKGEERQAFAIKYEPVIRAYLAARWRGSHLGQEIDEASQEVFVEFFRRGGPLERVDRSSGGFRPFLYGVVRNVARRFEQRAASPHVTPNSDAVPDHRLGGRSADELPADDPTLSFVFDRAWAQAILRDAAQRQREAAGQRGDEAQRRVTLLKLRFQDGLPIRDIAARWQVDAGHVHREYAKARREFHTALQEAVAFHRPGASNAEIEQECLGLLEFFTPRRG